MAKIAYVSAIINNYEHTAKIHITQSIPTDFVLFTDNPAIINSEHIKIIDANKYKYGIDEFIDCNPNMKNNLRTNTHSFMRAKFFKCNLHRIPELREYDYIVWCDGSIKVHNPLFSEFILEITKKKPIVLWTHHCRNGILKNEVEASIGGNKYTSTNWYGQDQPFQDVAQSYLDYCNDGFKENWFNIYKNVDGQYFNDNSDLHIGVWCTTYIIFDMRSPLTHKFLDEYWKDTLYHTTQDQVVFSYVCWKLQFLPYSLPDETIKGNMYVNPFTCITLGHFL